MDRKAFLAAFPHTIPVMAGYIFLGFAFGLLVRTNGHPVWLPVLMSVLIFSGALEFAAVPLLSAPFDPLGGFILGLMISARHLFYGIPMLRKYKDAGKLKPLMIFCLTDETFSVSSTVDPPEGVNSTGFYAWIGLLNYIYWNTGTLLGALSGGLVKFDLRGIDFALTALFIVLFIEQLKTREGMASGFMGLIITAAVLAIFGSSSMVLIAMAAILVLLLAGKKVISHD